MMRNERFEIADWRETEGAGAAARLNCQLAFHRSGVEAPDNRASAI
jgi:hypothetical protein